MGGDVKNKIWILEFLSAFRKCTHTELVTQRSDLRQKAIVQTVLLFLSLHKTENKRTKNIKTENVENKKKEMKKEQKTENKKRLRQKFEEGKKTKIRK